MITRVVQLLLGVVGADAGLIAVVPIVQAADDVSTFDTPIGHQRTAVRAVAVEHRDPLRIRPTDNDQVDTGGQGVGGFQRLQVRPLGDNGFVHGDLGAVSHLEL